MRFDLLSYVLIGLSLSGCSDLCIRNSDCGGGQSCQAGQCRAVAPDLLMEAPDLIAAPPDLSIEAPDLIAADLPDLGAPG